MAGKDLEYRLIIKDDGTAVLKRVSLAVDELKISADKSLQAQIQAAKAAQDSYQKAEIAASNAKKAVESQIVEVNKLAVETAKAQLSMVTATDKSSKEAATSKYRESRAAEIAAKSELASRKLAFQQASKLVQELANARIRAEKEVEETVKAAASEEIRLRKEAEKAAKNAEISKKEVAKEAEKAAKDERKSTKEVTEETKKQAQEVSQLEKVMQRIQRTVAAFVAVWLFREVTRGIKFLVEGGLELNATLEGSRLGIASILVAQGQFVDSTGNTLKGMEALNHAMGVSSDISKQLQMDNLKTAATYQQLVTAYQQTLAPGLAAGLNLDQIRQYTLAMVQTASAIGLNLDMLAEETRSMLRGTISPRNTLIAIVLGITPEEIRRHKGNVDELFSYIMGRLEAFSTAGEVVQQTWQGVTSNLKDAIQIVLGEGTKDLFDYLKIEMLNIQNSLIQWTPAGPVIDPNAILAVQALSREVASLVKMLIPLKDLFISLGAASGNLQKFLHPLPEIGAMFWEEFWKALKLVVDTGNAILKILDYLNGGFMHLRDISPNLILDPDTLIAYSGELDNIQNKLKDIKPGMGIGTEFLPSHGKESIKFIPRPLKLSEEEFSEIVKIRTIIGEITNEEIALVDKLNAQIPLYSNIDELSRKQLDTLIQIGLELDRTKLPPAYHELYAKLALFKKELISIQESSTLANIEAQIAEQNKNYDLQISYLREINELEIKRLNKEGDLTNELADAMRRLQKVKEDAIKRQATVEKLGWEEELLGIRASVAGLKGDLETQVRLEKDLLETTILRRIENKELREEYGKRIAEGLREKFMAEALIKLESDRIEKSSRIADLKSSIASVTGDYQTQAEMVLLKNKYEIESLDLHHKLEGVQGSRTRNLMNTNAELQKENILVDGAYERSKKVLDLQYKMAESSKDGESSRRIKSDLLKLEVDKLQKQLEIYQRLKLLDAESLANLQKIIGLTKTAGVAEIARSEYERWLDISESLGKYKSDIASLTGDWESLKSVELELLEIEYKRALVLGDLSEESRRAAETSLELKRKELEAQMNMDTVALREIGMRKYSIELSQKLADTWMNLVPNAIETSFQSLSNFTEGLMLGTKKFSSGFKEMLNEIHKGFIQILNDLAMMYLRMSFVKGVSFFGFSLPGMATGGPVIAGTSYVVGERGPEIFTPSTSGKITPIGNNNVYVPSFRDRAFSSSEGESKPVSVEIINESGVNMKVKDSKATFDAQRMVVTLWIDAAERNLFGLRNMLGS